MDKLKFSGSNAKLVRLERLTKKKVYAFNTLSGWSCPGANDCLSKVIIENGKKQVKDGPNTKFRCYSASEEALYNPLYDLCKHNFDLLRGKSTDEMSELISQSLPADDLPYIVRLHSAGDISCDNEFMAWMAIAKKYPQHVFYAYTKSLNYWVRHLRELECIPNLLLTASYGGRHDDLIKEYGLRHTVVVLSMLQARLRGLPVDTTDKYAALEKYKDTSFALLIHGIQPKNTPSSKAWQHVRKTSGGYNRKD